MVDSSQRLIAECKKCRREAQNELFRLYKNLVFSISCRYARNRNEADDLFQESFVEIFKSLTKKKNKIDNLEAWVCRVCINTCIRIYKKESSRGLVPISNEILSDDHIDILDGLSVESLFDIIGRLPDGYRIIFNLYFIDGYSHKEIADALNISTSTSRSQLTRAKKILKNELQKLGIYRYEAS